ncbi:MAG: 4-alpha-glucanotransferase [Acidimicrobiales bacterium]
MSEGGGVRGAPEPEGWGVEPGYWDVFGHWREVPAATVQSILDAMGASESRPPERAPVVTAQHDGPWPHPLPGGCLVLEDGRHIELGGPEERQAPQPGDLPLGYHRLLPTGGGSPVTIAVCPTRCPAPAPGPAWGWSVQLYAARSSASWGIGDFADLRTLARWARGQGAGFLLVNPLHAPVPGPDPGASPYSPSSRCFLNPLYIRVEEVPGAAGLPKMAALAQKATALDHERLIDRAAVWALKSEALEAIFCRLEAVAGDGRFQAYVEERGPLLDGYTTFCALAEVHGLPWATWPEQYRRPSSPAVAGFASSPRGRTRKRYHAWLQWLCEAQLAAATQGTELMCDIALGVDRGGADAWLWQEAFALPMRAGAPPDDFNERGQDWGLVPWDPWKLRAASYQPYIQMLRSVLRPARAVRVDHVMGLFRLFWIPFGSEPTDGAYVRYLWRDMVNILRLEAWRAGTYVVGEDLGTVEDYVREVLAGSGVLSYRLFWFEPREPAEWSVQALGAVTTHDLPTVAGVWTGADLEAQSELGLRVNESGSAALRRRIVEWAGVPPGRPVAEAVEAVYASLAKAPCLALAAVLDDAAAVEERPNMPGTVDQWPNWCLGLPVPLEEILHGDLASAIARHLSGRRAATAAAAPRAGN